MGWQAAIETTVTGLGYEVVDTERGPRGLLRVTIDRLPNDPTGEFVTVEDCEKVTRQLQHVLEVEGGDYERLEVSSPGLDRPLKTPAHFARFVGQHIDLTLKMPFQGRKRYSGLLMAGATGGEPTGSAAAGSAWRIVLDAPAPAKPGARKVSPKSTRPAAGPAKATKNAAVDTPDDASDQALDFAFDEVREARLVPVVDFKGRRAAPTSAQPMEAAEPGEGPAMELQTK